MIVEKVKNVTTSESPVQYEITIRVWRDDLTTEESDLKFAALARSAVNGIASYPIKREVLCNCSRSNPVGKPEKHDKNCARAATLLSI